MTTGEPCTLRYGGISLREAVRKVILRRDDLIAHEPAEIKGEVANKRML